MVLNLQDFVTVSRNRTGNFNFGTFRQLSPFAFRPRADRCPCLICSSLLQNGVLLHRRCCPAWPTTKHLLTALPACARAVAYSADNNSSVQVTLAQHQRLGLQRSRACLRKASVYLPHSDLVPYS